LLFAEGLFGAPSLPKAHCAEGFLISAYACPLARAFLRSGGAAFLWWPASYNRRMPFVEIYSSLVLADCEHRGFVLRAVGIEHVVSQRAETFVLLVPEDSASAAVDQLRRYEEESRPLPTVPPRHVYARAWRGSLAYAFVMLLVAYCAGADVGGADWYEAGALTRGAVRDGEWWRLVTALTLHADVAHLIANLVFGVPYGYFAAQLLGIGRAWFGTLVAAALANAIDSAVMTANQLSIGASTAVFAMLGLVAAYAWRTESSRAPRWAHRFAPLVAAIALLALTGVGGERTDVVAHLAGFFSGVVTGTLLAFSVAEVLGRRSAQLVAGVVSLVALVGAWTWALWSYAST
jgi:rhomboid protease GluP